MSAGAIIPPMRTLYAATTVSALALLLAACGGSTDQPADPPPKGGDQAGKTEGQGEQLFASNCGSCHTLSAAGTGGQVGPNLDDLGPSKATVVTTVTNGKGAMPSFSDRLSSAEIDEVATYVSKNAGQ
jgi:cytochrome c6